MERRKFTKTILGTSSLIMLQSTDTQARKKSYYLKPGDKVGMICPAGIINEERLVRAKANMESLDLVPVEGKYILNAHGYLAGTDKERLADLHDMFTRPDIQAVWCIRGGYGCTRLLPYIDFELIKKNPKPLLGYSDVTAFHHAFYHKAGIATYHSPVGASEFTPFTMEHVKKIILGKKGDRIKIEPCAENDALYTEGKNLYERYVIHPGMASGKLWGGNLSLLSALAGTDYLKLKEDSILFIEDIDEVPYRMDRMLTQLFQAIPKQKIKGVLLGVCEGCEKKENAVSFSLKEVILDRIGQLQVPAVYGFPFGHITHQCTLPMGAHATLDTNAFSLDLTLA